MKIIIVLLTIVMTTPLDAMFWRKPKQKEEVTLPPPLTNRNWLERATYKATHNAWPGNAYCPSAFAAIKNQCGSCCTAWIDHMVAPQGQDVELSKNPLEAHDEEGFSLLHRAAEHGQPELIIYLLEKGAFIENLTGDANHHHKNYTPLQIAIIYGKKPCIITLLRAGANKKDMWDFARSYGIEIQRLYEQADQEVGREQTAAFYLKQQAKDEAQK